MAVAEFARSGDARLFFEDAGAGTTVIFIHAGVADSRMWEPQFEAMHDGFRFIRLDLRGFGRTSLGKKPYADHDDVLAVMDHLEVKRAVLVVCSMGGATALRIARDHPDRVLGLVLIGAGAPGFEPESTYVPPQWSTGVKAFEAGDLERVAELEAEIWVVGRGRTADDVDRAVLGLVRAMDVIPLRTEGEREVLRDEPGLEVVPDFPGPALVVVGEHDLPQLIESAEVLAQELSDRGPVIMKDTAHLPSLEKPSAFNELLKGFLDAF
ncbi:MAG: alpha/beta fold hydrolase [Acidimicrobiia bacterium]